MISDEERREVAMSLRTAKQSELWRLSDGELIDTVADAIGVDGMSRHYEAAMFGRLADLIDRPTTKHDDGGGIYWRCEQCGAFNRKDAVTDLFSVIPSRHCANCGADVVSDED